jgi:GTP-binding protein
MGLSELKDILWAELNSESNKIKGVIAEDTLVHRDKDMSYLAAEVYDEDRLADEEIGKMPGEDTDDDIEYLDEDEIEDLEDFEYTE